MVRIGGFFKIIIGFIALFICDKTHAQFSVYPAYSTSEFRRNSEGDVLKINDTTYLLAYSQFYHGPDEFGGAQINSLITNDGGKTWLDNGVLQQNAGIQTTNSASFVRLNVTDVLLFYLVGNSYTDLKCYVRKSTNNANSFGSPVLVTDSAGYWVMNNARAVRLSSGRIVCPFSYTPDVLQSFGTNPAIPWKSRCIYSDDNGVTWQRSNGWITAPMRGALEPGIVELSGSLLMYIRTQTGHQYFSGSLDNGLNWGVASASTLISPESPATIIKSGANLIAVYNNNYDAGDPRFGNRTPLTVATSLDNGNTWTAKLNIEERPYHDFAYTSAMIDGQYLVLSYYDAVEVSSYISLKFRKILLSEIGL